MNTIKECSCGRYKTNRILTTFKVSDTRTYLICIDCGGVFAEWTEKIYPPDKDFNRLDLEDMT